jgi:hypothetical protein
MSTYSDIVAALDAAILAWCDKPVTLSHPGGRSNTYRSLDELIRARDYYAKLTAATANNPGSRLRFARFNSGGTV